MTRQTDMSDVRAAPESRAAAQQKAVESRFDFLHGGRFLNIGCGLSPMVGPEWENVDNNPASPASHHFDLREGWPLPDDTYAAITAIHLLEHFEAAEIFHILWEAGRVLKVGGKLAVVVPHGLHYNHYANPFHKFAWTEHTPHQFDRRLYERPGTLSTGADQGQKMRGWRVSDVTFLLDPAWEHDPDPFTAKGRHMNVIAEMSFVMTLEEK